jgi:hypothetical protein
VVNGWTGRSSSLPALRLALVSCAILASGLVFFTAPALAIEAERPTIVNAQATDITEQGARLEAQIRPGGEATYYFEYGTSPCEASTCGTKTAPEGGPLIGNAEEPASFELRGLKSNTTYHYWVVAKNSQAPGGVHGEAMQFTTLQSPEEIAKEQEDKKNEEALKKLVEEHARQVGEEAAARMRHEEEAALAAFTRHREEEAALAAFTRHREEEAAASHKREEEAAPKRKKEADPPPTGSMSLDGFTITVQSNGVALVKLNCLGIASCHGKLALRAKSTVKAKGKRKTRTVRLGAVSVSISGDETKTVKVKLDAAGRALLSANHGRLSASLELLELAPSPENTQTQAVHLVGERTAKWKKL